MQGELVLKHRLHLPLSTHINYLVGIKAFELERLELRELGTIWASILRPNGSCCSFEDVRLGPEGLSRALRELYFPWCDDILPFWGRDRARRLGQHHLDILSFWYHWPLFHSRALCLHWLLLSGMCALYWLEATSALAEAMLE